MRNDDRFRERIEGAFRHISPSLPPLEEVVRRSRKLRVRRYLGASIVAAVLLGALGLPLLMLAPLTMDFRNPSSQSGQTDEATAQVRCGEQTRPQSLSSPVVRQRDGVHFHLDNPGRAAGLWIRDTDDPRRSWARGSLADESSAQFVLPIPAGDVLVICLHPPVNAAELPREEFAELTILAGAEGPTPGPSLTPQ
jgi:hypothetical protein